jgi:malate synthase
MKKKTKIKPGKKKYRDRGDQTIFCNQNPAGQKATNQGLPAMRVKNTGLLYKKNRIRLNGNPVFFILMYANYFLFRSKPNDMEGNDG